MKPDDYSLQESQVIGPAGETIAVDDFLLTIPPGAFDSEIELKLYASSEDRPFCDHGVTRTFRLEGLPADFSLPLQLRIKYQGTLSEESFIAVGEDALILGSGELETMYGLYQATESSGYLICELPAREGGTEAYQANCLKACTNGDPAEKKIEKPISYLLGITDYRTYKSVGGHFNITYPRYVEEVVVPHLGDYLEDAYDTFKQMGFNYERDGCVKLDISEVNVLVRDLKGREVYAKGILTDLYVWGTPLKSRCTFKMGFNERKMAQVNLPKLRITAGREFFRAIPPLYARYASHLGEFMIDEAVAIGSAEKFTEEPNYTPPEFIGNEMAMFHGMYSGMQVVGPGHDKGMSAMIKYLVDYHGERALVKTYEGLATGLWGRDAILNSVDDPVNVWVPDFFKEYVSGNIYDVSSDVFTNPKNLAGVFNIKPEGEDTEEFFSGKYYDLSAKIYRINLPHSSKDIDSDAEIRFVVNSVDVALDDLTLLVFGLKDGRLQYFDDWTITNVKGLTEEGWDLIVVVVNSNYNKEDWKKLSEIELKVELVTTHTTPEISDDVSSRFLAVLPADFGGKCTYYQKFDKLKCHFFTFRDYHLSDGRHVASLSWAVDVQIHIYSTDKEVSQWWKGNLRNAHQYGGPECIIRDDRIVKGPYIPIHVEDFNIYDQHVELLYKNSIIEIGVLTAPTKEECESVADAVEGVAKRIIDENLLTEQMP